MHYAFWYINCHIFFSEVNFFFSLTFFMQKIPRWCLTEKQRKCQCAMLCPKYHMYGNMHWEFFWLTDTWNMNRLKQQQCMNGKLLDPKHTGPKNCFYYLIIISFMKIMSIKKQLCILVCFDFEENVSTYKNYQFILH